MVRYVGGILLCVCWILLLFLDASSFSSIGENEKKFEFVTGNTIEDDEKIMQEPIPFIDDQDFLFTSGGVTPGLGYPEKLETLVSIKEKIVVLERSYEQAKSFEFASLLLEAYLLDNRYLAARKLYYGLPTSDKLQLPVTTEFKVMLNSFSQNAKLEYEFLKSLFQGLVDQGIFLLEEQSYYLSAFALAEGRYEEAKNLIETLQTSRYSSYRAQVESAFAQYANLNDVPSYYQEGLIALALMKNGFYGLAKKLAIPLVNTYPNYILPYQVLANSDFTIGKWESAANYFQHLLEIDYQQKNNYLYHLGILNYQLGNYAEAVLYFSQITDDSLMLDGDRYLVLSYVALADHLKAFKSWQRLIGHPQIKKSDFYSFFEEVLRKPYRKGENVSLIEKNSDLVKSYLTLCDKKLKGGERVVCQYGNIAYQSSMKNYSPDLLIKTNRLAQKYQNAGLYQVL